MFETITLVHAVLATAPPASAPVTYRLQSLAGVPVHVVRVPLNDSRVRLAPILAQGGVGTQEPLATMAHRTKATAAITGSFFDTRSLLPLGDIVMDGKLVHYGGRGAALCLRPRTGGGWRAELRSNAGRDRHTNWGKSQVVLAGGFWLVRQGTCTVKPHQQGFGTPIDHPDPRAAVALTEDGELLLAVTQKPITLDQWAKRLQALGAVDAINYDGGSSTGLCYGNRAVVRPGRQLTNALGVFVEARKQVAARRVKRSARRT